MPFQHEGGADRHWTCFTAHEPTIVFEEGEVVDVDALLQPKLTRIIMLRKKKFALICR
jgi:hypothetical protein